MAEWRDILERAADNLSIDQVPFRHQPAGWPAQAARTGDGVFVTSRDLRAHELESPSSLSPRRSQTYPTRRRAPIMQSIVQPVAAPQHQASVAKKSSAGREIAALFISVGVVALAVYGIFVLLH